jgi:hypothetical protein
MRLLNPLTRQLILTCRMGRGMLLRDSGLKNHLKPLHIHVFQ